MVDAAGSYFLGRLSDGGEGSARRAVLLLGGRMFMAARYFNIFILFMNRSVEFKES